MTYEEIGNRAAKLPEPIILGGSRLVCHIQTSEAAVDDLLSLVKELADQKVQKESFRRPGNIIPLQAREGGVRARAGHTEATVDLCKLAGLPAVGVIGEVRPFTTMAKIDMEILVMFW